VNCLKLIQNIDGRSRGMSAIIKFTCYSLHNELKWSIFVTFGILEYNTYFFWVYLITLILEKKMKGKQVPANLKNPNDDSLGQCYAPKSKGNIDIKRRKHFKPGEPHPDNWFQIACLPTCNNK